MIIRRHNDVQMMWQPLFFWEYYKGGMFFLNCMCPFSHDPFTVKCSDRDPLPLFIDVDECVKSGVCLDGRCVNTEGSFQCQCQTGFTTNPEKTACLGTHTYTQSSFHHFRFNLTLNQDFILKSNYWHAGDVFFVISTLFLHHSSEGTIILFITSLHLTESTEMSDHALKLQIESDVSPSDVDECVTSRGSVCGSQRCENTIGSFRCLTSCEPGYQVTHTGECVGE